MRRIEKILGYTFKNKELLTQALTHKSFAAERGLANYNERLEFLGDSVLGLVVAHYVYQADETGLEGKLAKLKSRLVSHKFLIDWARDINLGSYIYLGEGERSAGRCRDSIMANAMEAVIGAIYLDGGFGAARKFINEHLSASGLEIGMDDFKSILQEMVQKKFKFPPDYEVLQTVGPEHEKYFTVAVKIKNTVVGRGKGRNKKQAQQFAARDALNKIKKGSLKL
jgi:ribonuclease-3